ncbi:MAG: flagellar motor switch protein FliM [Desulfobacterales bacterium]|nr:flagellar motor switch protein FliM [Desulfobacterales bacterium]MDD3949897.1 flagellar motor switch protein FliM [Desulfobacterales bacterium]MDD4463499.1 flagellar motor switch protein FliM [Desulfobacterales bacterium]
MSNILSQEEVDALLRGISGGEIETEPEIIQDASGVVAYDLTSQDRIIRGRMPTLEMTNEKFARMFRTTLSALLRKVATVSAISTDMIKFGEFLKTLPVPTSMHLLKLEPMRGNAIFVVESKIIFALVDILFGGSGKEAFKVEGREFTAIENNLIKRVVISALSDLERAWKPLLEIKAVYQRSEVNPQFAQIVPPTDVVVVINFEIEVEYTSGMMTMCIPYSALEPIREKLQAGFQSEQIEVDKAWMKRFKMNLTKSQINLSVELGHAQLKTGDVVNLKAGDVIQLEQYSTDPVKVAVEGVIKYKGYLGIYKGNQAVQISEIIQGQEVQDYETE